MICHSDDDPQIEQQEIRSLFGRQVEALLIASCNPDRTRLSCLHCNMNTPPQCCLMLPKGASSTLRWCDDRLGARLATEPWCGADTKDCPFGW